MDNEEKYPRSYVPKPPLKAKVIKALGGAPNGTGDTWTFTTKQLKRLGYGVAVIVSFAYVFGGRLDKYATLPEDLSRLTETITKVNEAVTKARAENIAEHNEFKTVDALATERNNNIQRDLKYLREDVSFIREQLERRK